MEHIKLHPKLDGQEHVVEFDFLGKDSIRYYNKVSVEKLVSGAEMETVASMAIWCRVSWGASFSVVISPKCASEIHCKEASCALKPQWQHVYEMQWCWVTRAHMLTLAWRRGGSLGYDFQGCSSL